MSENRRLRKLEADFRKEMVHGIFVTVGKHTQKRKQDLPDKSYTADLFRGGVDRILQKSRGRSWRGNHCREKFGQKRTYTRGSRFTFSFAGIISRTRTFSARNCRRTSQTPFLKNGFIGKLLSQKSFR